MQQQTLSSVNVIIEFHISFWEGITLSHLGYRTSTPKTLSSIALRGAEGEYSGAVLVIQGNFKSGAETIEIFSLFFVDYAGRLHTESAQRSLDL